MLAENDGLLVSSQAVTSIQSAHNLNMLPLLLGALHQGLFYLTFDTDGLSDNFSIFFLRFSYSLQLVGFGLSADLGSQGLRIRDNCRFNQVSFSHDLVVLDFGIGIQLVHKGSSAFLGFSSEPLGCCANFFDLFKFGGLLELCPLRLELSLLKTLLLKIFERLGVILDAELVRLLLSLKGVLELEDGLFLE